MLLSQIKLCKNFANSILIHFKRLNIPGKFILENNGVKIQILVYGKTISTTISVHVIMNIAESLESYITARYEIIEELTNALVMVGKNINESNKKSAKKHKERKRKHKERKRKNTK